MTILTDADARSILRFMTYWHRLPKVIAIVWIDRYLLTRSKY